MDLYTLIALVITGWAIALLLWYKKREWIKTQWNEILKKRREVSPTSQPISLAAPTNVIDSVDSQTGEKTAGVSSYKENKILELNTSFMGMYLGLIISYLLLIGYGWYYTSTDGIRWDAVATVFCIFHLLSSFREVNEDEIGAIIFFGKIMGDVESGLQVVPWPFLRLRRFPRTNITFEFGTLDESMKGRIERAESQKNLFVDTEPVRINWGSVDSSGISDEDAKQYAADPLAKTITTDPHILVVFRIHSVSNFIREIGSFEQAMELIRTTCTSTLQLIAGATFVAKARREVEIINTMLRKKVEELVQDPNWISQQRSTRPDEDLKIHSWGIDIVRVELETFGVPKRTNEGMAEAGRTLAQAVSEAQGRERNADAKRKELEQEGEGKANARRRTAEAEAHAIKIEGDATAGAITARARAAETKGGELIVRSDAFVEGMKHGRVVLMPADMSLMSGVLAGKTALDALNSGEPKEGGQKA